MGVDIVQRGATPEIDDALQFHQRYSILDATTVVVYNRIALSSRLPDLPRIGVVLGLRPGYEDLSWFGRGPHENYPDRKAGAPVGRYHSTVTDQYVPYILPQECGNKCDVRWLALHGGGQPGLLVAFPAPLQFSALHCTAADLEQATHTNELTPRPETIVSLDCAQRGLGGASCGPDTLEAYQVPPGMYGFVYVLQTFDPHADDPARLAQSARLR